ncbi:MAG: hypothetical protein P0Y58_22645 [Candidatus Pseudomonas phytovorans]|uniref:Uncharacterized protein n=1 Tax=Candidatus Pseudomonas phytovorans TaxID=3121377 RepID=A0AAJ5WDC0_9PSED|nr:hypothetical protein [Pseudomonas sp.]WEK29666.1 MAG: hypothetical protein P0Y58_22645 [Pseudomonas sp.]
MIKKRAPLSTRHTFDDPAVTMPRTVSKAMEASFGIPITAYLSAAVFGAGELYIEGFVFKDNGKRFDDGDRIRTSILMSSHTVEGYLVVQTLRSTYVICDWAGVHATDQTGLKH